MYHPSRLNVPRRTRRLNKPRAPVHDGMTALREKPASADFARTEDVPTLESLREMVESPSIAANVALEGTRSARRSAIPRLIEFFVLLTVGMLGWFLCSPVLPIPPDKHLRAISIALAEMLFLVGLGCLAARRPGFVPSALGRRFAAADPAAGLAEMIYAAAGAAAVSILGTRIVQMIVVKALWAPALAARLRPV